MPTRRLSYAEKQRVSYAFRCFLVKWPFMFIRGNRILSGES